MLRVLMGKARPDHEWTQSHPQTKMTTIQFNDDDRTWDGEHQNVSGFGESTRGNGNTSEFQREQTSTEAV